MIKHCSRCDLDKPVSDFSPRLARGINATRSACKVCTNVNSGQRRKEPPKTGYSDVASKRCSRCDEVKPVGAFSPDKRNKTGHQSRCKICISSVQRAVRRANPARTILLQAESRSRRGGLAFNLTEADVVVPDVCPVLGIPIKFGNGRMIANSPTLDRIIPSLGYVRGNVAVISWRANRLKGDGTPQEIERLNRWLQAAVCDQVCE